MSFRTAYWVPLGLFIVTSSLLYIRILILIFKKRHSQQYASFFYKMFFISGFTDLTSVLWYVGAQMICVDQIFGSKFLLDISQGNIPNLFYYYVYYFLYAQIFTITLVSGNRLCAIHFPTSRILMSCDRFPTIVLLLATILFPAIIMINFFFQPYTEFREVEGLVVRWVSIDSTRANTIHAICTVSVFSIFLAICYIIIIRKLVKLNRDNSSDHNTSRKSRREISLTIVGFSTFIALLLALGYFAVGLYAIVTENYALCNLSRDANIFHYLAMAFVNPWMLLITNGDMRKNIFRYKSSVACTGKAGGTAQTTSSRQLALAVDAIP